MNGPIHCEEGKSVTSEGTPFSRRNTPVVPGCLMVWSGTATAESGRMPPASPHYGGSGILTQYELLYALW